MAAHVEASSSTRKGKEVEVPSESGPSGKISKGTGKNNTDRASGVAGHESKRQHPVDRLLSRDRISNDGERRYVIVPDTSGSNVKRSNGKQKLEEEHASPHPGSSRRDLYEALTPEQVRSLDEKFSGQWIIRGGSIESSVSDLSVVKESIEDGRAEDPAARVVHPPEAETGRNEVILSHQNAQCSDNVDSTDDRPRDDTPCGLCSDGDDSRVNSRVSSSATSSRSLETELSSNASFDDWTLDREERRRPFRDATYRPDSTSGIVELARSYQLRPRESEKDYRESPAPQDPVRETWEQTQCSQQTPCKSWHVLQDLCSVNAYCMQQAETRQHSCPCHNIEICISMFRALGEEHMISKIERAGRAPRMTLAILAVLYPQAERMDELNLLCHRVIVDDDQNVHESAPYVFLLNGWVRDAGNYHYRLNKFARDENMDEVEEQIDFLLALSRPRIREADPTEAIGLTGDDD